MDMRVIERANPRRPEVKDYGVKRGWGWKIMVCGILNGVYWQDGYDIRRS
jgi:hypothetical protein